MRFVCIFNFKRNGSIIVDYQIFTSPEYTGSIQDLKNALMGRLNNSYLGAFAVKTPVIEGKQIGVIRYIIRVPTDDKNVIVLTG